MTGRPRLDRLYTFARSEKHEALENFTTEALASAIEVDPGPFLRALPDEIADEFHPEQTKVRYVGTQVHVVGGIVDLVVELAFEDSTRTLWVEVKAHAGESGQQITAYQDAIAHWHETPPPVLIMLCKYPLREDLRTLRWNELRAQIKPDNHVYWTDLRRFLEDHQVADDADAALTNAQLASADDARALLRKTARIATEFLRRKDLPKEWQDSNFPTTERKITSAVARHFAADNQLFVKSRRYPWICFGIDFLEGPALSLWIVLRGTDDDACNAVFKLVRGLPSNWRSKRKDETPWIRSALPLTADQTQEAALNWLFERVKELEKAGVLAALPKWRRNDRIGDEDE